MACNGNKIVTKGRKHIKEYNGEYFYVTREGFETYYYQEPCSYFEETLSIYNDTDNKKAWYIKQVRETSEVVFFVASAKTTDREAVLILKNHKNEEKSAKFYNNRAKPGTQSFALGEVEYGKEVYVTLKENPAKLETRYCYDFDAIFEKYPKEWIQLHKKENEFIRVEQCKTKDIERYTFANSNADCENCKPQLTIDSKNKTFDITNAVKEEGKIIINYSDNGLLRNFKILYHPNKNEVGTFVFTPSNVSLPPDTLYFTPAINAEKYTLEEEDCH